MDLKINWTTDGTIHRASLEPGCTLTTKGWSHSSKLYVTQIGFVIINRETGRFRASLYTSVSPDTPEEVFDNLDDAERYVEQHGIAAIVANQLTS